MQPPDHNTLSWLHTFSICLDVILLLVTSLPVFSVEQETLTGFKWMGNRARNLLHQGKTVLFAFEEAIGTCTHNTHKHQCHHLFQVRSVGWG